MKRLRVLTHLLSLGLPLAASAGERCHTEDTELVSCAAPAAPAVTGLKGGYVILEYSVGTDGAVSDIRVLESGGDPRWKVAAKQAVSGWRYNPRESSVSKTQRFDFTLQ
jgi:TonB family protein